jgi:hypothetical protein
MARRHPTATALLGGPTPRVGHPPGGGAAGRRRAHGPESAAGRYRYPPGGHMARDHGRALTRGGLVHRGALGPHLSPGTQGLGHRSLSGPYPEPRGGDLARAPRTWALSLRVPYPGPRGESRARHRGSEPSHSEGSRAPARGEHRAQLQGFGPSVKRAPARRHGPRASARHSRASGLHQENPGQEARARASCRMADTWPSATQSRNNPGSAEA